MGRLLSNALVLEGVGSAGPGVGRFTLDAWILAMEGPPFSKLVLGAKPKVTNQVSEPLFQKLWTLTECPPQAGALLPALVAFSPLCS